MRCYLPRPPEGTLYSMACITALMVIGRAMFYDLPCPPELPLYCDAGHDGLEGHGVCDHEGIATAPAAMLPADSTRKPAYQGSPLSELLHALYVFGCPLIRYLWSLVTASSTRFLNTMVCMKALQTPYVVMLLGQAMHL